jgi:hypothetical protein
MGRILEVGRTSGLLLMRQLIHEWKNSLCVHSKYKDDLVHIRDMHRLLSFKGGPGVMSPEHALIGRRLPFQVI